MEGAVVAGTRHFRNSWRLFQRPLSVDAAFDLVDAWLQQPSVTVPEPDRATSANDAGSDFAARNRGESDVRRLFGGSIGRPRRRALLYR